MPQNQAGTVMKIGIIGAGNIGSARAGYFRTLRRTAWIVNSRRPEALSRGVRITSWSRGSAA